MSIVTNSQRKKCMQSIFLILVNLVGDLSKYDQRPKCAFDCESFGHICCRLGDEKEECRKETNCPNQDDGKEWT